MPLADYRCPLCGHVWRDVYFSCAVGATLSAPECHGHLPEAVLTHWIPQVGAIDAKEPFQRFSVYQDNQRVEIDSLHKLRQVERTSEQRYIDGEGEPLRFRAYAQNSSNLDSSSFGDKGTVGGGSTGRSYDNGQAPQKKANIGVKRHGQKRPTVARGTSALPLK